MYFWDIDGLKEQLSRRALPRRIIYLQFVLLIAALEILRLLPYLLPGVLGGSDYWRLLNYAVHILTLVMGTMYCYQCNGGDGGEAFFERLFSLFWVFGIRYSVLVMMPAGILFGLATEVVLKRPEWLGWANSVLDASLLVVFYARLGFHIQDVAKTSGAPRNGAAP